MTFDKTLKLLVLAIFFLPLTLLAQNGLTGKTSLWHAVTNTDKDTKQSFDTNTIIRLTNEEIGIGPSENELVPMNIRSSSGHWNTTKNIGKATYEVAFADATGRVIFFGSKNKIYVQVELTMGNGTTISRYGIDKITYQ